MQADRQGPCEQEQGDSARRSTPNSASTHWPTPRITRADLHVQQALDLAALVPDDSGVTADAKDGIITLAGHVRTWAEHDAVAGAALMARGVIDIRDYCRSPA